MWLCQTQLIQTPILVSFFQLTDFCVRPIWCEPLPAPVYRLAVRSTTKNHMVSKRKFLPYGTLIETRTDVNAVPHASLSEKPKETGWVCVKQASIKLQKPPKLSKDPR